MSLYDILLFAHVMLFVYWLGSDVGVFYGIGFVTKPELSLETRQTIMSVIHWIDAFPRVCLVMMVPVGLTLSIQAGFIPVAEGLAGPLLAVAWIACLAWLYVVLRIYAGNKGILLAIDMVLRVGVMLSFFLIGLLSLSGIWPVVAGGSWLAVKMVLFALVIACGLGLRWMNRPTGEALGAILAGNSTPEAELKLRNSVKAARGIVILLWSLVAVIAYLGLIKPV